MSERVGGNVTFVSLIREVNYNQGFTEAPSSFVLWGVPIYASLLALLARAAHRIHETYNKHAQLERKPLMRALKQLDAEDVARLGPHELTLLGRVRFWGSVGTALALLVLPLLPGSLGLGRLRALSVIAQHDRKSHVRKAWLEQTVRKMRRVAVVAMGFAIWLLISSANLFPTDDTLADELFGGVPLGFNTALSWCVPSPPARVVGPGLAPVGMP